MDEILPAPTAIERFNPPGVPELFMDLFSPSEKMRNKAAVIFIHGGGWSGGNRQQFLWHAHQLSLRGYFTCTIDYRLSQPARCPAAVEDCQSAVRWLRGHSDCFGIRPDRIGVFGSSAGGHLAACLGVCNGENHSGALSAQVNCVVDIHGVHHLPLLANSPHKTMYEMFIGGTWLEKPRVWEQASPALHVNKWSAPMFLTHDPDDNVVPYAQTTIMADALKKEDRPVQFHPTQGAGHGFIYDPKNPWTRKIWPVAVAWLDSFLVDLH